MSKEVRRTIGQRLKDARLRAKLKQEHVAGEFECSRQAVSAWENGRALPDLVELSRLAILYGVSTDRILLGMDCSQAATNAVLRRASASAASDPSVGVEQGA